MLGKFNSFINHAGIDRKKLNEAISGNENLNYLISQFLDRKNWNGPRMDEPVTWPAWLRLLARAILDYAERIQIMQVEASTPIAVGATYDYDAAGSISNWHKFIEGAEYLTSTFANKDDSRLSSYTDTTLAFGEYIYDHLGQRVIKNELGTTVFIYDIFGNMISEFRPWKKGSGLNIKHNGVKH